MTAEEGQPALRDARRARVKALVTERFRNVQATARAKAWEQAEKELAEALGIEVGAASWSSMIPMVVASAAIADRVMTGAFGPFGSVDTARRAELLTLFGIAEEHARVQLEAEQVGEDLGRRPLVPGPDDAGEEETMTAPAVRRCPDPTPHGAHTVGETYCPGGGWCRP